MAEQQEASERQRKAEDLEGYFGELDSDMELNGKGDVEQGENDKPDEDEGDRTEQEADQTQLVSPDASLVTPPAKAPAFHSPTPPTPKRLESTYSHTTEDARDEDWWGYNSQKAYYGSQGETWWARGWDSYPTQWFWDWRTEKYVASWRRLPQRSPHQARRMWKGLEANWPPANPQET